MVRLQPYIPALVAAGVAAILTLSTLEAQRRAGAPVLGAATPVPGQTTTPAFNTPPAEAAVPGLPEAQDVLFPTDHGAAAVAGPPPRKANVDYVASLEHEVIQLRRETDRLQETLDYYVLEYIDGLRAENTALRTELDEATAALAPATETFEVVAEWGRSPGDVVGLRGAVPTLKGLIAAVPPGPDARALEDLGRSLCARYAEYDNLSIYVFDSSAAARRYADSNRMDTQALAMTVTRHPNQAGDRIIRYENQIPVPVPAE